ncbi:MAG: hypothetical protein M3N54_15150, partial [Acidobacteriota bacterium]|nr:hypothetical protein [Acidobacteriota bacterium]
APHALIRADREGESVVLTPIPDRPAVKKRGIDSMPTIEGTFVNPHMTFRREDMYDFEDE